MNQFKQIVSLICLALMLWFYSPLPALAAETPIEQKADTIVNNINEGPSTEASFCNAIASASGVTGGVTVAALSGIVHTAVTGAVGGAAWGAATGAVGALLHGSIFGVVGSAMGSAIGGAVVGTASAVALPLAGAALTGFTVYEVVKMIASCDNLVSKQPIIFNCTNNSDSGNLDCKNNLLTDNTY